MKFIATLLDGRTLTDTDFPSVSLLPLPEVTMLVVVADGAPPVTLKANIFEGERINFFTRHSLPVGNPDLAKVSIPVFEIRKYENTLCRLYWHPEKGPLLTSQDLYF